MAERLVVFDLDMNDLGMDAETAFAAIVESMIHEDHAILHNTIHYLCTECYAPKFYANAIDYDYNLMMGRCMYIESRMRLQITPSALAGFVIDPVVESVFPVGEHQTAVKLVSGCLL